nr:Chain E, EBNA-3 nuclear protein [synthetic construct]1M05_F Chain F, EBNA-3 nuclear protein [synthetic construct]1MI5_C Chain C, Epstein Barr Virus peptide3FFC_C Chain C, FLRGRAYGL peptide from an EBV protein [synthetic construct]3FFC_H Chain H, FLRGRAYGL peptide from an EBV protein [synthetic construct]3SJV_C Chain C, Epstein-Barr nuclear antigen 3 [human gammaherpesvirus 4]3SJV_H Chain H, Epstein-Barr nuclear antigen 3 [human gammaherpesvirus 4]3SJV_M Chain M, Epstein-Barr nuclear antig
FLRGRAYGL